MALSCHGYNVHMSYFISVPLPETAMSFLWILVVGGRVANKGHRDGRLVWSTYLASWFGFVILPGCGLASQTKRQSAKGRTTFVSRTYTGKVSAGKEQTVPRVGGGAGSGPSAPPPPPPGYPGLLLQTFLPRRSPALSSDAMAPALLRALILLFTSLLLSEPFRPFTPCLFFPPVSGGCCQSS